MIAVKEILISRLMTLDDKLNQSNVFLISFNGRHARLKISC